MKKILFVLITGLFLISLIGNVTAQKGSPLFPLCDSVSNPSPGVRLTCNFTSPRDSLLDDVEKKMSPSNYANFWNELDTRISGGEFPNLTEVLWYIQSNVEVSTNTTVMFEIPSSFKSKYPDMKYFIAIENGNLSSDLVNNSQIHNLDVDSLTILNGYLSDVQTDIVSPDIYLNSDGVINCVTDSISSDTMQVIDSSIGCLDPAKTNLNNGITATNLTMSNNAVISELSGPLTLSNNLNMNNSNIFTSDFLDVGNNLVMQSSKINDQFASYSGNRQLSGIDVGGKMELTSSRIDYIFGNINIADNLYMVGSVLGFWGGQTRYITIASGNKTENYSVNIRGGNTSPDGTANVSFYSIYDTTQTNISLRNNDDSKEVVMDQTVVDVDFMGDVSNFTVSSCQFNPSDVSHDGGSAERFVIISDDPNDTTGVNQPSNHQLHACAGGTGPGTCVLQPVTVPLTISGFLMDDATRLPLESFSVTLSITGPSAVFTPTMQNFTNGLLEMTVYPELIPGETYNANAVVDDGVKSATYSFNFRA